MVRLNLLINMVVVLKGLRVSLMPEVSVFNSLSVRCKRTVGSWAYPYLIYDEVGIPHHLTTSGLILFWVRHSTDPKSILVRPVCRELVTLVAPPDTWALKN